MSRLIRTNIDTLPNEHDKEPINFGEKLGDLKRSLMKERAIDPDNQQVFIELGELETLIYDLADLEENLQSEKIHVIAQVNKVIQTDLFGLFEVVAVLPQVQPVFVKKLDLRNPSKANWIQYGTGQAHYAHGKWDFYFPTEELRNKAIGKECVDKHGHTHQLSATNVKVRSEAEQQRVEDAVLEVAELQITLNYLADKRENLHTKIDQLSQKISTRRAEDRA